MRELPLSANGLIALIDDEDWERVSPYNWRPLRIGQACYAVANVNGPQVLLHRFILNVAPWTFEVDHKDHNGLNCTRSNMRLVTRSQNAQNRRGADRDSLTGVRNVTFDKRSGRYQAKLRLNYRNYHLGYFTTLEEAERAAIAGRIRLMTHAAECA